MLNELKETFETLTSQIQGFISRQEELDNREKLLNDFDFKLRDREKLLNGKVDKLVEKEKNLTEIEARIDKKQEGLLRSQDDLKEKESKFEQLDQRDIEIPQKEKKPSVLDFILGKMK